MGLNRTQIGGGCLALRPVYLPAMCNLYLDTMSKDAMRPPFALAGIWRAHRDPYGGGEPLEIRTSSMVTTVPSALLKETHPDRMPVILDPADYAQWMTGTPDEAFELCRPFPADRMVIHQSGERVKSDRGGIKVAAAAGPIRGFARAAQPAILWRYKSK